MTIPVDAFYIAMAFTVLVTAFCFGLGFCLGYGASESNWRNKVQADRMRRHLSLERQLLRTNDYRL